MERRPARSHFIGVPQAPRAPGHPPSLPFSAASRENWLRERRIQLTARQSSRNLGGVGGAPWLSPADTGTALFPLPDDYRRFSLLRFSRALRISTERNSANETTRSVTVHLESILPRKKRSFSESNSFFFYTLFRTRFLFPSSPARTCGSCSPCAYLVFSEG